jgi:hypothetical protein
MSLHTSRAPEIGQPLFATSTNSMGLPTTLECSHISVTCDIQAVNIWVHWRELDATGAAVYYIKSIYNYTLRNEKYLQMLIDKLDRIANTR